MQLFDKIKFFFMGFIKQKVDGYICTFEQNHRDYDNNTEVINKYNVAAIKFNIPFLDKENHWIECYFIPKQAQQDLFFLSRLVRTLPIVGIFKKRKFIGFEKDQYDLIELWSQSSFREIRDELYQEAHQADIDMTLQEEERARIAAQKHAEKLAKKAAIKEQKRLEKEKIKQEKLAEKQLEKEAKKLGITVEQLKKKKEKENNESE